MSNISLLQWTSAADWPTNRATILELLEQLPTERPLLVVLPEAFSHFGAGESAQGRYAEAAGEGEVQDFMRECARNYNIWLLAGTIPVRAGDKHSAASLLYNADGDCVAHYNKLHLFDAAVDDGTKHYRESAYTKPGEAIVVIDTPFGRLGLAVCYDLRFPEMFRAMLAQGAELIALPSAFTQVTGQAHWDVLVRARAIENQVYMLAPNQVGTHADGRQTWGHSMIVDPWGKIMAVREDGAGVVSAKLDLTTLHELRKKMPVITHTRFEVGSLK
ncbi:MAG: carbon-nitrogen hydrolase family protein [Idiomarina sp.]|nr:carbon-nitrogen hydrolase family protein [Idiomarina sp.]